MSSHMASKQFMTEQTELIIRKINVHALSGAHTSSPGKAVPLIVDSLPAKLHAQQAPKTAAYVQSYSHQSCAARQSMTALERQ